MMTPDQVLERLRWRYAVKTFDRSRKLEPETWKALEQSLLLSPSSFGLQPWRFVVISDPQLLEKLPAISWGQSQPRDCSHMVVLGARRGVDEAYVDEFLSSVAATRGVSLASLAGYRQMVLGAAGTHQGGVLAWNTHQVYLALGQFMTTAAMLGVDTCPMEGLDLDAYDELLGWKQSEYTTVVGCAVGYRSADDLYARAPKVRFRSERIIQHR
jgi:nitroreductase